MELTKRIRLIHLLMVAILVGAFASSAHAQAPAAAPAAEAKAEMKDEAVARYNRGMELYDEKDFQAALTEFRKAYELSPTYKLLYKIGQVCYRLQDYACALKNFEQYLVEGTDLPADRRKEVMEEINLLRNQVGKIEVTVNVPGAAISIDDNPIGMSPLEAPVGVSVGKRKLSVTKEGRAPISQIVEVAGGEVKKVKIDLLVLKGETRTLITEAPSKWTVWSWVGVGAAVALAGGATVTGLMANKASDDLKDIKFVGSSPSQEATDKQSSVKNLALTTDILATTAVVTFGMTLVLTYARPTPQPKEMPATPEKNAPPTAFRMQPLLGLGSVGLRGEF